MILQSSYSLRQAYRRRARNKYRSERADARKETTTRLPYLAYGAALALQEDYYPEIVISGAARTGKTRAGLEKIAGLER